jgi:colanic acid/amylovoran biosynthesis glycosyltransferase
MKVAYIASRYPHISHTFIRREIDALRAAGVEVDTFTVRRSEASDHFSYADMEADRTTTAILPISWARLLKAHGTALRRNARAYVRTLLDTVLAPATGMRMRIWRAFYFIEGMVLWWECERRGIRHVHAHFANVGADVARVAATYGRTDTGGRWSWSFTMHGYTEFFDMRHFDLPRKTDDADAVVCISDFARSQLMIATPPETWEHLHIVHCGINVGDFVPGPERPDDGTLNILSLGRMVVEKGPRQLVEALALVVRSGVDATVTFAGDGPARASTAALAAELGVADRVTFLGAVRPDHVIDQYHAADVFCLPSFAEGVPVVLMEAMSCQLPVVTTYITGIPELVTDGVNGHTVTPGRADLLADAICGLVDPEIRRRMGVAGRSVVEREYDISSVGPQLRDLLADLPGLRQA